MTKELILIRHAEASEAMARIKDIERELTAKGYRDAPHAGRYLSDKGFLPDRVICSNARRAISTVELIVEQVKFNTNDVELIPDLYNASVRTLLAMINNTSDEHSKLLVVGHNPTISYFAEYVSGEPIGTMSTAGIVFITFNVDSWEEVSQDVGKFIFYEYPE